MARAAERARAKAGRACHFAHFAQVVDFELRERRDDLGWQRSDEIHWPAQQQRRGLRMISAAVGALRARGLRRMEL